MTLTNTFSEGETMALKLNRYFTTTINIQGSELTLRMKRMSATGLIDYSHEIEILQQRLEDKDKSAIKDIYLLNIELLCDQIVSIEGLEDEDGNVIGVPKGRDEQRELYNELGIEFINSAANAFARGADLGNGEKKQETA
jgi:hypothetical protein